jgi:murein DD-endopeptidase MepM/ murein hydrolase activator NlpD
MLSHPALVIQTAVDMEEPTLLPLPSCFQIPVAELSAASTVDCSQSSLWPLPVPVDGLRQYPSQDGGEAQIQDKVSQQHSHCVVLSGNKRKDLRKRFYILFVARAKDGQLRKIPIPIHYAYVFLIGATIGILSLTGIASSYLRMLWKVSQFNQLRTEKEDLKNRYTRLEQVAKERDIQVASLGSLASEVSSLYGLKSGSAMVTAASEKMQDSQINSSLDRLFALKTSAISGATMTGISLGLVRNVTTADWLNANSAPNLWPVEGPVTGSFGERIDPFNGEGAFHSGIDIGSSFGQAVIAPADGMIVFADFMSGYGRVVMVNHGHGITTRYGHLANFAVTLGQQIHRGDTLGYVGLSGRSTGPHLHYEVRINDTPVNPHKYLRLTFANVGGFSAGS